MKSGSKFASLAVLALLMTGSVPAKTIRVPSAQPTIQAGISAATTNDTVLIAPGVYTGTGNVNLTTAGKTLTVMGEMGADSTIIDCDDPLVYSGFSTVSSGTTIQGLTIKNGNFGINCGANSPRLKNNRLVDNYSAGVYFAANGYPVFTNNSYSGNSYNLVYGGGNITGQGTFSLDGAEPYIVSVDIVVDETYGNAFLTIPAGLTLKFKADAGLHINRGRLNAVGTPDSMIVFTSYTGLSQGWDGIRFSDQSDGGTRTSSLTYCLIENAGQGGWGVSANLYCNATNQPLVSECVLRNATGIGIYLHASAPLIQSNVIQDNTQYGVYMECHSFPTFKTNQYSGNPINIAVGGGTIDWQGTWSKDGSEPYVILNDITVDETYGTAQLTIPAGLTLKFKSDAGLQVNRGQLTAVGKTPDSMIVFTSYSGTSQGWDGLLFNDQSDGGGRISNVKYCIVENAGQGGWEKHANIYCYSTNQPLLRNCVVRNAAGVGVYLHASAPLIQSNVIQDNTQYGIYMECHSFPIFKTNQYSGNPINIAVGGGTMDWQGTWSKDGAEPYVIIDNDLVVDEYNGNALLTIPAGLELRFMNNVGLAVGRGRLIAVGKPDSTILFTSYSGLANGWDGIHFNNQTDEGGRISNLRYCVIEKAGQSGWGWNANLFCDGTTQPTVKNCTIRDATGTGIVLTHSWPTIQENLIENNSLYGVYLGTHAFPPLKNNQYAGNGQNIVVASQTISIAGTWSVDGIEPYAILGDVIIDEYNGNALLTIRPGLRMEFKTGADLQVGRGRLNALGTPDSTIIFTANNHSSGGWGGLYFADASDGGGRISILQNCIIEKAGQTAGGRTANVNCYLTSQPAIRDCIIRRSASLGVDLQSSSPTFGGTKIIDNDSIGIWCNGTSQPLIADSLYETCHLYGNGSYDIYNNTSNTIFARHNFWGTVDTLQIKQRIYDKSDNAAKGVVQFQPVKLLMHDAGVLHIVAPDTLVDSGTVVVPQVILWNNGLTSETITVFLRISSVYQADTSVFVSAGATLPVEFRPWIAEPVGSHPMKCFTSLAGDDYPKNDTISLVTVVQSDTTGPVITSVTPEFGGNTGARIIEITGRRFRDKPFLRFTKAGEPDINVDTAMTFFEGATRVIGVVDLTGAALGSWSITLTNADGKTGTLVEGFEVQVGHVEVWTDLSGRGVIRANRPATFGYRVGVYGNVDVLNLTLTISGLPESSLMHDFGLSDPPPIPNVPPINWNQQVYYYVNNQVIEVPVFFPAIRGGDSFSGTFTCSAPPGPISLRVSHGQNDADCLYHIEKAALAALGIFPPASCAGAVFQTGLVAGGGLADYVHTGTVSSYSLAEVAANGVIAIATCAGASIGPTAALMAVLGVINTGTAALEVIQACPELIKGLTDFIWNILSTFSIDPNDKAGPTGFGDSHFVYPTRPLFYQVYFENVDTAQIEAEDIIIIDTLDTDLDWSTLTFGQIFPGAGPDSIRPFYNYTTDFNPTTGVITWTLNDINLPPDTMPYWGEGWVSYSVKPKAGLPTGTRIENIAAIKFDDNPWILAPMDSVPIFNTIDAAAPTSGVASLPDTTYQTKFWVTWVGADDSAGSGIAAYSIYYSKDSGPYELWIADTVGTSAEFEAENRHHYSFACIARDNVGHVESLPLTPDATTYVGLLPGDADGDRVITIADAVYLVRYIFNGGPAPVPFCTGDCDCMGEIDIADVVYLVNYIFVGGPAPCDACNR